MPGAQKIERERVVKDVEVKVRMSWEECGKLLRLIYFAQQSAKGASQTDSSFTTDDRAAIAFSCDLKMVLEEAMGSEASHTEM